MKLVTNVNYLYIKECDRKKLKAEKKRLFLKDSKS